MDTSVAVALVVADHEHHASTAAHRPPRIDRRASTAAAVGEAPLGLAGHAAFETFSVLTRLPPPIRRSAADVCRLLTVGLPMTRFLDPAQMSDLLPRLGDLGILGGAVYDALVGATAQSHRMRLLTRDSRALNTYQRLGVEFELLD